MTATLRESCRGRTRPGGLLAAVLALTLLLAGCGTAAGGAADPPTTAAKPAAGRVQPPARPAPVDRDSTPQNTL
ncbi:hypothetical protein ABZX96_30270, partial [Streptomyces sp. NPDC003077]